MPSGRERERQLEEAHELEVLLAELERRKLKTHGFGKFTEFVDKHTKFKLSPAQRVWCKISYDGDQPSDLNPDELVLFKRIFGDIKEIPQEARELIVGVCGARAGKTHLSSLRILHLALTVDISELGQGDRPLAVIIGPNLVHAEQAMNYIIKAIDDDPALSQMLLGKASSQKIRIIRDDQVVLIEPRAALRGGLSARGFSLIAALLDEAALFRGTEYQIADDDIFQAVYTRLIRKTQCIVVSTPWIQEGLLYKLYEKNWGHPVDAICAHAPSLLMVDSEKNRDAYARLMREDPEKARVEMDAEFISASIEAFFDPTWIERSIDDSLNDGRSPMEGDMVKAGADFGFERDSSALVITHVSAGMHYVAEVLERRAEKQPLRPSEVVKEFADTCKNHFIDTVMADKWYRQNIIELLNDNGLFFVDSPHTPADAYIAARLLMHQGQIRIPRDAKLIAQLKAVRAKRLAGGKIQMIPQPRKKGSGHGDIVSAFVLCLFQACGERIPISEPDKGTPEHAAWINDKLKESRRIEQIKDFERRADNRFWKVSPGERIRKRLH